MKYLETMAYTRISMLALSLVLAVAALRSATALECLECPDTLVDCDAESCTPTGCTTMGPCVGYCMAATFVYDGSTHGLFTCLNETVVSGSKETFCQTLPEDAGSAGEGNSCTCHSDGCNKVLYMANATLPQEATSSSPSAGSAGPGKKLVQKISRTTSATVTAKNVVEDTPIHCLECPDTPVDCDAESCTPTGCTTMGPCVGYCMAATFVFDGSIHGLFTCLNNSDVSGTENTFCQTPPDESSSSAAGTSCICHSDGCNKIMYMPDATLPDETSSSSPSSGSADPGRKPDQKVTKTTSATDLKRPSSGDPPKGHTLDREILVIVLCSVVPAALLTIVIAVAGYIHLTRYPKPIMDELNTQAQTSNTESTSIDMTTDESETKHLGDGDGYHSPPESPVHLNGNYMPITLDSLIGKGRFGAVWKANWRINNGTRDRVVAVKIFTEYDSASWNVEKELFTDHSVMLRHENVVQFIAAEVRGASSPGTNGTPQYWIITRYYKNGSLHEYLRQRNVNWIDLCKLCGSAARGLAHMHAETYGSQALHKVPVAHRDLKSTNILVKDDGTCAIADFGLAIRLDPQSSTDQLANSGQVGTPRYMSPEALECKVNLQDIESFKQMDTYALALILWEIASRCSLLHDGNAYELPFSRSLGERRASIETMRTLVVVRGERPPITDKWLKIQGLTIVKNTIVDCWDEDPEARLTASCVEARFQELILWHEGEPQTSSFYTSKGQRGRTTLV